jgi:hypothetical protein
MGVPETVGNWAAARRLAEGDSGKAILRGAFVGRTSNKDQQDPTLSLPRQLAKAQGLNAKRKTRTPKTIRCYESHVRLYLIPHLGHLRLDRLAVSHIDDLFDTIDELNDQIVETNAARRDVVAQLRETRGRERRRTLRATLAGMPPFRRTVGPATKQRIRATLRSALSSACKQRKMGYNPARDVELPSGRSPRPLVWNEERVERWRRTGDRPSSVMSGHPARPASSSTRS